MCERCDIAVVGAGAAGLFAAIWAARTARAAGSPATVVAFDGARTLGAKILVAGGGRCNVTHHAVSEADFAGASRNAIRRVLGRFGVARTIEFFRELGVELIREETGKLFPSTDRAKTVLDALLTAARDAGVSLRHPWRVGRVFRDGSDFVLESAHGDDEAGAPVLHVRAASLILATGGKSLPKSGSDGAGYEIARGLGHTITPQVFPALVPLTTPSEHFLRELSGLTVTAGLEVRSGTGKKLAAFVDSTLCTHFGLSGPGPLNISRYLLDARNSDPAAQLVVSWIPAVGDAELDAALCAKGREPVVGVLQRFVPARLAEAICRFAGVEPALARDQLPRERRRALVNAAVNMPIPVTGTRGFQYAEVTAGGVPLSELRLETMESRVCPGLFLCGEICDVDGRIGGFNFQWAWASGFTAGTAAAAAAISPSDHER